LIFYFAYIDLNLFLRERYVSILQAACSRRIAQEERKEHGGGAKTDNVPSLKRIGSVRLLTILNLQEILDQVLHQTVLLCHIPLKINNLAQHLLVVPL
jgi:hypothetical protein